MTIREKRGDLLIEIGDGYPLGPWGYEIRLDTLRLTTDCGFGDEAMTRAYLNDVCEAWAGYFENEAADIRRGK